MKINEKNLIGFAASESPIDKDGWLLKRGEVNKSFQRRWFVLKGNLLFYYEKKADRDPVGVIILEGCTIELAENEEQYTFKIVFHGAGDRTYILGADSQETMETWMKSLACASYDYMKLMVSELQRQLDDMLEVEKQQNQNLTSEKSISTGRLEPAVDVLFKTNRSPILERSSSSKSAHKVSFPQQRSNPFNRCQSDGDFERMEPSTQFYDSAELVGGRTGGSAPGTPQILGQQRGGSGGGHKQCVVSRSQPALDSKVVKRTHEVLRAAPPPPMPPEAFASLVAKNFYELHNKFGARIIRDVQSWQINNAMKKQPIVSEPLIVLD